MVAELESLAKQYPRLAKLFSLGKSYEGRDMYAMKVRLRNKVTSAKQ